MKLCILHCAKHGVYAISVESQNGGIRITPNKCCGSWHTVREFKLSPAARDELSKAAESAARRGRAARKEAAMSEVTPEQVAEWARHQRPANPTIVHCDNCGCDWVDNGINPIGCPYCKTTSGSINTSINHVRQA